MTPSSFIASAHAKINLGLEILRKRSDGYHEISTIFCPIGLSDDIRFTGEGTTVSLSTEGIDVPADGMNLCVRAADLLRMERSISDGVRMEMLKRIPVGGGLGGGSSDAACVLRSLNRLWNLGYTPESLAAFGAELGADVPYFLFGGLCHATGIGERLFPLSVSFPYWIVTVVPPVQVSTRWAYDRIRPREADASPLKDDFLRMIGDLDALDASLVNDFEQVVLPAFPEVQKVKLTLQDAGLSCVRMSGSGAAVFGLSRSEETARGALALFGSPYIVSLTPPVLL